MIRSARQHSTAWRHVFLTLAVMAIALRIMIPPGFMIAAPSNDLPFPIVLCTGDGMVTVGPGGALPHHGDTDKAPDQDAHDSPCAFAGHGAAAPPPVLADAGPPVFAAYLSPVPTTPPGLTPGRGLTGPPLPARGPPVLLI